MFRQLREDAREYPATIVLGGLWILVFALMVLNRWGTGPRLTIGEFILGLRGGHRFGDLTIRELYEGEVWRAITATFVHYGLLHLGMNLYAMYHLGCLVESWYGSGPLLGIYVLTGGGGNALSALVRSHLNWDPSITSGGGSVVVMGLVALCAVVGWGARTRLGDYLRNQMILVLVLTAGIGLALPFFGLPIIDNWGHACGALVGGVIGMFNARLARITPRGLGSWVGGISAGLLAACAVAQVVDDRVETRERRDALQQAMKRWADNERLLFRLEEVRGLHRVMTLPRVVTRGALVRAVPRGTDIAPSGPPIVEASELDSERVLYKAVLAASLAALDSMASALDKGPNATDFQRVRELLAGALRDPPTLEEFREFEARILGLQRRIRLDLDAARTVTITKSMGR